MSDLTVLSGQTVTSSTNIGGTDAVNVAAGGAISVSTATPSLYWNANATGPGITIVNNGTIEQTGTGGSARAAIGVLGGSPTGTLTITNTGVIQSAQGPGLNFGGVPSGGSEIITNSGTISGGSGVAIQFGAGDDTLNLQSGYSISGTVEGGAGVNTLNLSGGGGGYIRGASEFNGPSGALSFAGFDDINNLNVNSGTWTLYGGGYYDNLTIASGSTFVVDDTHSASHGTPSDGGLGPLNTSINLVNNGTITFNNNNSGSIWYNPNVTINTGDPASPFQYSGSGAVTIAGGDSITPKTTFIIAGPVTVTSGTLLSLGVLSANVTVNPGAALQIGGGGASYVNQYPGGPNPYVDTGLTGAVNGNIVDNGLLTVARFDDYALPGALTGTGTLVKTGAGVLTLAGSTNFGGAVTLDAGTLSNGGAISTNLAATAAITSAGDPSSLVSVTNAGSISSTLGAAVDLLDNYHGVSVTNSGSLIGGTGLVISARVSIDLSGFADTLTNSGHINGAVHMGGGGDTLNIQTGSAITGLVDGGAGADTVSFSGAHANFVIHTALTGGAFVTSATDTTGAVGATTLENFETYAFGGDSFNFAGIQQNHQQNLDGARFDDVLFQRTSTGTVYYQEMNGTASPTGFQAVLGSLPAGWHAVGSADINGDGRADTLIQDASTGSVYYIDQAGGPSWNVITTNVNSHWQYAGAGDLNGDGQIDILLRDSTTGVMLFRDIAHSTWGAVANPGTGWKAVGVGDFNRDGSSDVAIQNQADGTVYYANMAGGVFSGWGLVTGAVGTDWKVAGVGDVNGDGYADVIFQNQASGVIWYVDMQGGSNHGWVAVANVPGWTLRDVADVNNDGYADLVIQNNTDGTTYYADMHGGTFHAWGVVSGAVGTDWIVA